MMPQFGLLPGTTLALLIIAAFQLWALRRGEHWRVPEYATIGAVVLVVVELFVWVVGAA